MSERICEVPVFYATTEGQTRRIAEHLAACLRQYGINSQALDVQSEQAGAVDWSQVRGALVGASLHMHRFQTAGAQFVRAYADDLGRVPSAFFAVSLSAASSNPEEVEAAKQLAEAFPVANGWKPAIIVSLAGRLAYTQYNFVTRFLMKRIARKQGAPLDTRRDHEFTNWDRVEQLAREIARLVSERRAQPAA